MARRSASSSGGYLFKTGIFALLAGLAYWIFNMASPQKADQPADPKPQIEIPEHPQSGTTGEPAADSPKRGNVPVSILPSSTTGEVVTHTWFALSYAEDYEQPEWVAYELTVGRLNENWAERPNTFRPDPEVRTESATPRDYTGSGYDKGHLCPAADMAFDATAIDESFFMSNISPQVPSFNKGIWRELEELTRDWARRYEKLYVVTGPVLTQPKLGEIGFSKVAVPAAFYKVLYAPGQQKTIAFVIPNAVSAQPVTDFAMTIDEVEKRTGIDFFPELLTGADASLETFIRKEDWPVNKARFAKRLAEWNR